MTATASEPKSRAPKAIAVSKLIGGKLVTTLGNAQMQQLSKAKVLCVDLMSVADWQDEAKAAAEALNVLLAKVSK